MRSVIPAQSGPHPPRHQGGQHPADGEWHGQAGGLRQRQHQVPRQQFRRHALLDGAGSYTRHGRRTVRWKG